jgi:methionyl-tRNA formyltransferase
MRIVFFGSPELAVPSLEALKASDHDLAAVVTQPDRPSGRKLQPKAPAVKLAAEKLGIPILQPGTTKTPEFLQEISTFRPDVLAVVAYGEILRPKLLAVAPHGAVNLHASLLPKYRGASPIAWAILQGEAETGVTTILMNEAMDAGPILLQATCPIDPTDTAESLGKKIAELGAPLLKRTLDLLEDGELIAAQQDLTRISYAPKLKKEDGWIDWNKPASWISRQVRAFDPWPGTFSTVKDTTVKFWAAHPAEQMTSETSGTVIDTGKNGLWIAAGEGTVLQVLQVQPENRPRLQAYDFINGYQIRKRDRFQSDKARNSE